MKSLTLNPAIGGVRMYLQLKLISNCFSACVSDYTRPKVILNVESRKLRYFLVNRDR